MPGNYEKLQNGTLENRDAGGSVGPPAEPLLAEDGDPLLAEDGDPLYPET